ncbi:branched-chain amino acid ABC transporter permease [Paenalcaligenes suwonensis]|uniref:branched-chain amino acid ABC transporter permease n=1 Tax=Paenalcaligenes suwonensis TaxID=1202713 RepID=UPI00140A86FA|nr:branched-chain amino acid ABC transporter permease [Paenalcaligenes suwonensis]NHC62317.1 branched-chain amino acid ABC transporter permease [Paenalcaligenes suwonensis]
MYSMSIVIEAILNGVLTGSIYALIALGLTLVYGVLHIINFSHGAMLAASMFLVLSLNQHFNLDPYIQLPIIVPALFIVGYVIQRFLIGPGSHGRDENILIITLGLSIVIENVLLAIFRSDVRSLSSDYSFDVFEFGPFIFSQARVFGLFASVLTAALLWVFLAKTNTGKAIRAVSKEKLGASLVGINVKHIYAVTFGIGCACLAVSASLLLPTFYVYPSIGSAFVLVAFTVVVLGGMGSIVGALVGGIFIGIVESLCGLFLGESLGQIGIFITFILVLLFKPTGFFGAKA